MVRGSDKCRERYWRRGCDGYCVCRCVPLDDDVDGRWGYERQMSHVVDFVSGNSIREEGAAIIAFAISGFSRMTSLKLPSNRIRCPDSSTSRSFFNLLPRSLTLLAVGGGNTFSALPDDFFLLRPKLSKFDLGEGFIDPPQSVVAQGREAVEAYFEAKRVD
jgi:hypothetical protein